MFRVTRAAFAAAKRTRQPTLNGFSLFLRKTKGDPSLAGLPIAQRGRRLGKMWRALPASERAALSQKARVTKIAPKVKPARKPHPFRQFIKKNYSKVADLPPQQRLKALAKMYKA